MARTEAARTTEKSSIANKDKDEENMDESSPTREKKFYKEVYGW